VVADEITVLLDDRLLFGGAVTDTAPLPGGTVGLFSDEQRSSQFDNVTVNHVMLDAHAGRDQRVLDRDGDGAETVLVSAAGSYGPAGLVSFEWRDAEGNLLGSGETTDLQLGVGVNQLTLVVTDANGDVSTDRVDVEVVGQSRIWVAEDFDQATIPADWMIIDEGEFGGLGPNGTDSDWKIDNGRLVQDSDLKSRQLTWQGANNADVWLRGWSPHGDGVKVLRLGTYALYEGTGADAWENYSIEATISTPDNEGLGFLFRYIDENNHYKLELDAEGVYDRNPGNGAGPLANLIRKQDGIEDILGQVPLRYTPGEAFTLRVDVLDNRISTFLNGEPIYAYAIEDRAHQAGTVGLYSWGSEGVAFDEVRVIGLDPADEPVIAPDVMFLQGALGSPPGTDAGPPPADPALVAAKVVINTGFTLAGERFTLVENTGIWDEIRAAVIDAAAYLPAMGTAFLFANFVDVRLALGGAVAPLDLVIVGAQRGEVEASLFADTITWIAHSSGGTDFQTITIDAGAGDDVITVRAVASSPLDDALLANNADPANGPLWNAAYDGAFTLAEIEGGAGNDTIRAFDAITLVADGGDGDDTLIGAAGDDTLDGGDGDDRANGGAGDDMLDGGAGDDKIQGADGDDTLDGGDGDDVLLGQDGNDTIDGGAGNDYLDGGAGDDDLSGGDGNDVLRGGSGVNRLDGGAGLDTLFGGTDQDVFVLANAQPDRDSIRGFQAGTDVLEIEAALFGAGLAAGALDPGRLVVGANPSATAPGQFLFSTTNGTLRWDADGPGGAPAQVIATLVGVTSLAADDFIIV